MKSKKHSPLCFLAFFLFFAAACGAGPGTDDDIVKVPIQHSVTVEWDAPDLNTNGTPLSDLAGYVLYYGPSEGFYTASIDVKNANQYTIENLLPGQYHITVTAYDAYGNESAHSSEVVAKIP